MSVSVIIPALNEEGTVADVVRACLADDPLEVLVIDADSTDETAAVARAAGAGAPRHGCGAQEHGAGGDAGAVRYRGAPWAHRHTQCAGAELRGVACTWPEVVEAILVVATHPLSFPVRRVGGGTCLAHPA